MKSAHVRIAMRSLALACTAWLGGCIFYDQVPYKERAMYCDAQLLLRHYSYDPKRVAMDVIDGDAIVLVLTDGYSHGRVSTAHGSHKTYMFQIPGNVESGQRVHCTVADGTLAFEWFGGWYMMNLEEGQHAEAVIDIQSVSPTQLRAQIDSTFHVRSEHGGDPQVATLRDSYMFARRPVPKLHSCKYCADRYVESGPADANVSDE